RRAGRAVLRLRSVGQDDRVHADGGRRRQGRLPALTMKFGAMLALKPLAEQLELVRRVEALGFDSVWTGDHVSFHGPIHDPLTLRAPYVPVTARLRLGTGGYLLALRPPAIAAKAAATLDVLSGGR